MFFLISVYYINLLNEIVVEQDNQLLLTLEKRLHYSAEAVSTTFYMIDKYGIDSTLRLSGMYDRTRFYDPFPIKPNAEGYELYN